MDFFCKLLPPRADFALTMTPDELRLMQQHAAYWKEAMGRGHVVTFGLVGDPRGAYGIGIVTFPGEAEARAFTDADPTIRSDAGFAFEVMPMPLGAARA